MLQDFISSISFLRGSATTAGLSADPPPECLWLKRRKLWARFFPLGFCDFELASSCHPFTLSSSDLCPFRVLRWSLLSGDLGDDDNMVVDNDDWLFWCGLLPCYCMGCSIDFFFHLYLLKVPKLKDRLHVKRRILNKWTAERCEYFVLLRKMVLIYPD